MLRYMILRGDTTLEQADGDYVEYEEAANAISSEWRCKEVYRKENIELREDIIELTEMISPDDPFYLRAQELLKKAKEA